MVESRQSPPNLTLDCQSINNGIGGPVRCHSRELNPNLVQFIGGGVDLFLKLYLYSSSVHLTISCLNVTFFRPSSNGPGAGICDEVQGSLNPKTKGAGVVSP